MPNLMHNSQLKDLSLDDLANMANDIMDQSVYMVGHILTEARSRFPADREFGEWRSDNLSDLESQTALRLMYLVRAFPDVESLGNRPQSAGYLIGAIDDELTRARMIKDSDGKSFKQIKAMITKTKGPPAEPIKEAAAKSEPTTHGEAALKAEILGEDQPIGGGHAQRAKKIAGHDDLARKVLDGTITINKAETTADARAQGAIDALNDEYTADDLYKKLYKLLPLETRKAMEARALPSPTDLMLRKSMSTLKQATEKMHATQNKDFMIAFAKVLDYQGVLFERILNESVPAHITKKQEKLKAKEIELQERENLLVAENLVIPPGLLQRGWTKDEIKKLRSALHPDKTGSAETFQIWQRVMDR